MLQKGTVKTKTRIVREFGSALNYLLLEIYARLFSMGAFHACFHGYAVMFDIIYPGIS